MPLHDKPVSNYPLNITKPFAVVTWLQAEACRYAARYDDFRMYRNRLDVFIECTKVTAAQTREGQQ